MFRGKFKSKDETGNPVYYANGDVVIEQGRAYSCIENTVYSPLSKPSSWILTGLSSSYSGSNPPINPVENQTWISDSGKQYIWYKDTDGFQWIEI